MATMCNGNLDALCATLSNILHYKEMRYWLEDKRKRLSSRITKGVRSKGRGDEENERRKGGKKRVGRWVG